MYPNKQKLITGYYSNKSKNIHYNKIVNYYIKHGFNGLKTLHFFLNYMIFLYFNQVVTIIRKFSLMIKTSL